jgi:hypothetical protein
MRIVALVVSSFCFVAALAQGAAPPADWKEFTPLIGSWTADPAGPSDATRGGFTLERNLSGRVLVRKNFAEYPKTANRPASRHDDLMVIYKEGAGTRADYYDNEGHVIRYAVTVPTAGTFVFQSDAREGQPTFRLTQAIDATGVMAIRFEIAPPNAPADFKPYITASAHKKK